MGLSDALKLEDQEGDSNHPVPEHRLAPRVNDLDVHMLGETAGSVLSHAGSARWLVPLSKDGLGKTIGRLWDILRREDHCVPSSGKPVKVVIDKIVAELTGEAGAIDAPESTPSALGGGGCGRGGGPSGRGGLGGAKVAGRRSNPKASARPMDNKADRRTDAATGGAND